ncbi:MAG TPA: hypothetical protein VHV83_06480, partial [Armatimonadota bacterium]|nr:hypothetical protein [Armatimonadota bacterium]
MITLKVYCEANIPIRSVNLRLTDAHGEVFQWNNAVKSAEAGWQELSYPLTRDTVAAHWGGDTNHTLDFPVSLQGFALVFAPKVAGSGVLYIDDIAYMNSIIPDTGVRQLAQSQLMHFDGNESWRIYTKETGVTTETTDHGLVCTIPPADADGTVSLADASNAGKRALDHPVTLTLHAELLSGTNTELSVRFRDGQGETHQLRLCRLQPGMNTMTWHMPDDIVANWGTNKNGVMESPVLVQEIFLLRHAGKEPVKIRFADSMIQEMRPTLACVTADVETGNPIHVLKVGEEKSLGLRLTNSALTTLTCRLRVQLEGFYGETITDEKDVKLAPQGDTIVPLPIPKKLGIWWLNYTLQDPAGDATVTGRRSFCYMQPAGPTPGFSKGFLLGVCSHPERWGLADQEREALAATLCGAKTLRSEFNRWQGTQPTPDRWDFTVFDRLVDMYGKQGIEVQYLFLGLANWAQRPEKGSVPADMTTWARYVSTVAKRYQGRIRYWEIWNEPDLGFKGTNEEYLSMLRTAYHEIKAVDPKMQVLTAGFATLRWGAHPDLVDYVTQHGTQDFDILAMHV